MTGKGKEHENKQPGPPRAPFQKNGERRPLLGSGPPCNKPEYTNYVQPRTIRHATRGNRAAGRATEPQNDKSNYKSYAKGGRVTSTGKANLHKNELVLPVALVKQLQNLMKK